MTSSAQRRLAAYETNGYDRTGRHQDWDTPTPFCRYDPLTGEVLETGVMPVAGVAHLETQNGWAYLRQSAQLGVHYVDLSGDQPRRRTRSACPASLDGYTILGLPTPCTVEVVDQTGDATLVACDEPVLALEFDFPGVYAVTVRSVPHTDGAFTIEVDG